MESFIIKLAGHSVSIKSRYEISRRYFADYMADQTDEPEIYAAVSDEALEEIAGRLPDIPREIAEITELYRPIAEAMPALGGFVFHGAAITFGERGYIFAAPSGTGKSTHIRLWRKYLGDTVDIVNGDKPIITVADDGTVFVHGTPWAGKERWQKNRSVSLAGICLLHRGESCRAEAADPNEILPFLFTQTYLSRSADVTGKTMELIDAVMKRVPIYSLYCDVSEDAVRCSFEMMCGLDYDAYRA